MKLTLALATALFAFSSAGTVAADPPRPSPPPTASEIITYSVTRKHTAAWVVAENTSADFSEVIDAWSDVDQRGLEALYDALSHLGAPYRYASRGPSFDCSGLTGYAWAEQGIEIGRNSRTQNRRTSPSEVVPGALVYRPGHIAMSLGFGNWIIHAANKNTGVVISRMDGRVTYPNL